MNRILILAVVSALLAAGTVTLTRASQTAPATQPAAKPVNKICPVEKEEIDADVPTVTYQGKVIGFCCKKCIKTFNADPEKYMKDLK